MTATRLAFSTEGMHCASCTMLIDEVLEDLNGVRRLTTKLCQRRKVVGFDADTCGPDTIVAAIADAGYIARPQS